MLPPESHTGLQTNLKNSTQNRTTAISRSANLRFRFGNRKLFKDFFQSIFLHYITVTSIQFLDQLFRRRFARYEKIAKKNTASPPAESGWRENSKERVSGTGSGLRRFPASFPPRLVSGDKRERICSFRLPGRSGWRWKRRSGKTQEAAGHPQQNDFPRPARCGNAFYRRKHPADQDSFRTNERSAWKAPGRENGGAQEAPHSFFRSSSRRIA